MEARLAQLASLDISKLSKEEATNVVLEITKLQALIKVKKPKKKAKAKPKENKVKKVALKKKKAATKSPAPDGIFY